MSCEIVLYEYDSLNSSNPVLIYSLNVTMRILMSKMLEHFFKAIECSGDEQNKFISSGQADLLNNCQVFISCFLAVLN